MSAVYLLCFDDRLPGSSQPNHYLGYTGRASLVKRLREHSHTSNGAAIIRNGFRANGIHFTLVRTWPGASRAVERALKQHHNPRRLCPVCTPNARGLTVTDATGKVLYQRKRFQRPRTRYRSDA